jgi:predicted DNA-binding transcriptional regulator AlpA
MSVKALVAASPDSKKKLLTTKEVAELLGLEVNTLDKWRINKSNGPAWIYVGKGKRSVRYDQADVDAFIEANKQRPNIIE